MAGKVKGSLGQPLSLLRPVRLRLKKPLAGPYTRLLRRPGPEVAALGSGHCLLMVRGTRLCEPVPLLPARVACYYPAGGGRGLEPEDFKDPAWARAWLEHSAQTQVRFLAVPVGYLQLPNVSWVSALTAALTPWREEVVEAWRVGVKKDIWMTVLRVYECDPVALKSPSRRDLHVRIRPLGLANLRPVLDDKTFAQRLDLLQEVVEVQGRVALSTYAYTPKAERPLVREEVEQPAYSAEAFAQETGFAPAQLHQWEERLRRQRQLILYGPPGTGKTYLAERLARRLTGGTRGFWELVQFHPSYAYEDFVQGIRPVVRQGVLTYELVEGRFLAFCHRARDRENAPCALVIDEINRAHLARVFGELMYLLEYRDRAVPLAAGGEPFALPGNVHLIGTMNTADRSIALVDQALRRRFAFIRLRPEYGVLARCLERHGQPSTGLVEVLRDINRQIGDANYELGISFFMRDGQHLRRVLPQIWKGEVEPYLEEVFYDRPEQVEEWRWEALAEDRLKEWTE